MTVTTPSGRMLVAPATPTSGAATPPKPNRTIPSRDDAVPAIRGYSARASVVAGVEEIATPLARANSETMTTHSGSAVSPDASRPAAPIPATRMPMVRVPGMLHRSDERPERNPKIMKPAELSANAAAYACGESP